MKRNDKFVVGITGGSGVGKSHLAELLKARGYAIIDADVIAKEVMEKGEECLNEVAREFGDGILDDGHLNRKRLAGIVFSDSDKLDKLNKISHKYILRRIEDGIRKASGKMVFVDGAVLIESGFTSDAMIGIVAEYDERVRRIMRRDSLSEEEAKMRIDAQQKDDFYHKNCDLVIDNKKEFDVDAILQKLNEMTSV